jgi:DNA-binding GntR family transcriptional regulator
MPPSASVNRQAVIAARMPGLRARSLRRMKALAGGGGRARVGTATTSRGGGKSVRQRQIPAREPEKLADVAYRTVLERILAHDLPGGSVIQERKLAESMGVSRTPMREALGRLEGEGLLVRLTERLLAVRVITLEDYLHSLDVRAVVEPHAAALAARAFTPSELQGFEAELEALARADAAEQEALHWRFDDRLHESIAAHSGNPFLAKTIHEMRRYTKIFERQTVPARVRPGIDDHRRLLAAFAARRPEKVREAMIDHIRNMRKRMLDGL